MVRHPQLSPLQRKIFHARLNIKSWKSQWSLKSRSRALGHSAYLKRMSRTIMMQDLTLIALTTTDKYTLMLDSTWITLDDVKSLQSHSSMKSRSRVSRLSACLKSMSRTITMQGLTLIAITASEKYTLMLDDVNSARLGVKSWQSHSSTKCRSRTPVQSACLKSVSRTNITQFLLHPAITASDIYTLMLDST